MAIQERDVDMQDEEDEEVQEVGGETEGEGSGEEEEFEIDGILDSKRGIFEKGQIAYYVSWKGYGPQHNSWVKDSDAENARDLIIEYWAKLKAKKAEKSVRRAFEKAEKAKPSSQQKTRQEPQESSPPPKKRSRLSKAAQADEDEGEEPRKEEPKKRGRKSAQNGSSKNQAQDADDVSASPSAKAKLGTMDQYKHIKDWEPLVENVITVEKGIPELIVDKKILSPSYSKTEQGLLTMRESSTLCRKRFPQKLLDFYERNLRWRSADEE